MKSPVQRLHEVSCIFPLSDVSINEQVLVASLQAVDLPNPNICRLRFLLVLQMRPDRLVTLLGVEEKVLFKLTGNTILDHAFISWVRLVIKEVHSLHASVVPIITVHVHIL